MAGPKILCIDDNHDDRGVFVQAYLECLRLWLANCTDARRWLFSDVTSCGLYIETPFSKNNKKAFSRTLQLARQSERTNRTLHVLQQCRALDSSEKRSILARVGSRELRGLYADDFQSRDMIICFDRDTVELLCHLRSEAERDTHEVSRAKIHYIPLGKGWEYDKEAFAHARKNVRVWAERFLGFRQPEEPIREGRWRTLQVVVNEYEWWALVKDNERRRRRIEEKTGVRLFFGRAEGGKCISVVGDRDRVQMAARLVSETF
ncbi:hypothetical protein CJF31_00000213 [Rutstroemia sp. NJR-2017a BVV2]|nr:hypothetical protein CJF31_00000213 [Rutstroemia sp. NJR-2017a BVV2]